MSVQIALGAPATRVASRKLGPVAGSRSPPAASVRAAWETSTLASTCGRCETVARIVSWVSGSIAVGGAPRPCSEPVQPLVEDPRGRRGRRQVPGRAVEQVGARVLDAGRLGAGERVAADESRVARARRRSPRLVEPTSVTTQSAGAAASTSSTASGSTPTGTADEHRLGVGDRLGDARAAAIDRAARSPASSSASALGRSRRLTRRAARARRARSSRRSARRR